MIFLRPWCLLLLLVPFMWRLWKRHVGVDNPWTKEIDAALLPYLWVKGTSEQKSVVSRLGIGALWILLCVAVSGPAWEKVPVPTQKDTPGTVIVMDLSPAMTGKYLQQARIKIADILENLGQEQVGLALYDKYGYTAVPVTSDKVIVQEMLPALNSSVLPERVYNPAVGLKQAVQMMKEAGLKDGRIIFITAGAFEPDAVAKVVGHLPYRVAVLGIGAQRNGQPISLPGGGFLSNEVGVVTPVRLSAQEMGKIGVYESATPDNRDVRRLLVATAGSDGGARSSDNVVDVWQDMGIWLMIPAVLLASFLFRKGMFFLFLIIGFSVSAKAGLWLRPDQERYQAMVVGESAYRAGDYETALTKFKEAGGVEGLYNQGNALAQAQKIEEAIAVYEAVLKQHPNHVDAAYNKDYLEKQLEKQKQENSSSDTSDQMDKSHSDSSSGTGTDENKQDAGESSSENDSKNESESDESQHQEMKNSQSEASQSESNKSEQNRVEMGGSDMSDSETQDEKAPAQIPMQMVETSDSDDEQIGGQQMAEDILDQASEEILNRLPSDPARVLRYRIYQQYQRQKGGVQ